MSIRLLIVEDHDLVREALRVTFRNTDVAVVAEATGGREAVRLADRCAIDVVLLDIGMPDISGFETLRRIRLTQAELPVLVYSMHDRLHDIQRIRELGATGYLIKSVVGKQQLLAAIRDANAGATIWPAGSTRDRPSPRF